MTLERGLERARNRIGRVLIDRCDILTNAEERSDDTVDPVSLAIIPGSGEAPLHTDLACSILPVGGGARSEGEAEMRVVTFRVLLPADIDPVPPPGAILVPTRCKFDPTLVGRRLMVGEIGQTSFLVVREVMVEDRARRPEYQP